MALTQKERDRRYYLKHIDSIKKNARERYLKYGRKRGEPTDATRRRGKERVRRWREANPEKYETSLKRLRLTARGKALERKREVIIYYGGGKLMCVTCGEGRLACLSIDHIEGGGTNHRRQLRAWGDLFYRWLKAQNYPKGYQTLCMNCQFVKRSENGEV